MGMLLKDSTDSDRGRMGTDAATGRIYLDSANDEGGTMDVKCDGEVKEGHCVVTLHKEAVCEQGYFDRFRKGMW